MKLNQHGQPVHGSKMSLGEKRDFRGIAKKIRVSEKV